MATMDIKVRNVELDTAYRLDVLAKKHRFKSRQEFLHHLITRIAFEEVQFESDSKYAKLLSDLLMIVAHNTNALNENNALIEEILKRPSAPTKLVH